MWSTLFLFSLLLGASSQHPPDDDLVDFVTSKRSRDEAQELNDWSTPVVEGFLRKMEKAIADKNEESLNALFLDGFVYTGCKGAYDKAEVVGMLMKSPASFHYQTELIYSKWINYNVDIDYIVIVHGFGEKELTSEFTLTRDNIGSFWRLSSGKTPICSEVATSGSLDIVTSFMKLVRAVVKGKDPNMIGDLFMDSFVFYGCKAKYLKGDFIQMLLNIPPNLEFYVISTSFFNSSEIYFSAVIDGVGSNEIVAEFQLFQEPMMGNPWRFNSGAVKNCGEGLIQGKRGIQDEEPDDRNLVIFGFLDGMKRKVASKDQEQIGTLFDDQFIYHGCNGSYNKDDAIKMFLKSPVEFSFKSSVWTKAGTISFRAKVSGVRSRPFDNAFVYCPYRNVLMSGKVLSGYCM